MKVVVRFYEVTECKGILNYMTFNDVVIDMDKEGAELVVANFTLARGFRSIKTVPILPQPYRREPCEHTLCCEDTFDGSPGPVHLDSSADQPLIYTTLAENRLFLIELP